MPRFGASREDPRKAPCAYPFGLGPNGCCLWPLAREAHPARASRRMRDLGLRAACGGWPRNARCGSQSGLKAREAKGVVLVWNPKRPAPWNPNFRGLVAAENVGCRKTALF